MICNYYFGTKLADYFQIQRLLVCLKTWNEEIGAVDFVDADFDYPVGGDNFDLYGDIFDLDESVVSVQRNQMQFVRDQMVQPQKQKKIMSFLLTFQYQKWNQHFYFKG